MKKFSASILFLASLLFISVFIFLVHIRSISTPVNSIRANSTLPSFTLSPDCEYFLNDSIKSPNGNYVINSVVEDCEATEYSQHLFLLHLDENENKNEYGEHIASHSLPDGIFASWDAWENNLFITLRCKKEGIYHPQKQIGKISIHIDMDCFKGARAFKYTF